MRFSNKKYFIPILILFFAIYNSCAYSNNDFFNQFLQGLSYTRYNSLQGNQQSLITKIRQAEGSVSLDEAGEIVIFTKKGDQYTQVASITNNGDLILDASIANKIDAANIPILKTDILSNPELLVKFGENSDLITYWEKIKLSLDPGISAKSIDISFLNKFDNIVKNNNLGLDVDGLTEILNAAVVKGQQWDFPENILDAVQRASDSNISGILVSHKKFPVSSSNPYVLRNAKQYQYEASLDANLNFELNGVSFDNIDNGILIDRKFGHSSSIWDSDGNIININRIESLREQAFRQINASNGVPIRWEISTSEGAANLNQYFIDNGINIQVIHIAQKTFI